MVALKDAIFANWELINRLAVRRFGASSLAEEAALAVMDQLMENDGSRLHGYEGRASLSAFLAAVSWRLLEDFSRKRFGRRRAPLWIRNLGGVWLQLYGLLCLQRLDITEAVAAIRQRQSAAVEPDLEEAAWTIRQQVIDCGSHQGLEVEYNEEYSTVGSGCGSPGEQVEHLESRERKEVFRMLFHILTDAADDAIEGDMEKLCSLTIKLNSEETLLLKLCYQDGISVTRAGEMLGLNRYQVHGRMRRLLRRLRDDLERAGLAREIVELL